jgi:hypothetical protein
VGVESAFMREQELDQPTVMRLPSEIVDLRTHCPGFVSNLDWHISIKRSVNTFLIVKMMT